MDLIRQAGPLALASRFRRLADWLYKDAPRIYQKRSVDFEPRWFPLFYLLRELGEVSVTEAASILGFSHPAINQIAGQIAKRRLLESIKDRKDERKRILRLTRKGKIILSSLEPVWADIEAAASELLSETGVDFLVSIKKLEDALSERGMYERVMSRVKDRQLEKVEIFDYKPRFKRYFRSLNLEWLQEYFSVEEADERLLSDPYGKIIKTGGFVLYARLEGKIIGTTALVKHGKHTFELTKMAVTRKARGHQVGRKLALVAIERAKDIGAKKLVLLTSPKLTVACNLYRLLGFVETSNKHSWVTPFKRESIAMSLDLKK